VWVKVGTVPCAEPEPARTRGGIGGEKPESPHLKAHLVVSDGRKAPVRQIIQPEIDAELRANENQMLKNMVRNNRARGTLAIGLSPQTTDNRVQVGI